MKFTETLVKNSIKWYRKGLDEPNYIHSIRVRDMLQDDGYSKDICEAGLLHDIIEDSPLSVEDLKHMGYSKTIIDLVVACTHDDTIKDSFTRRKDMMDKISESGNEDALIIKIADLTDNMKTCHLLNPESYQNFLYKKAPYIMGMAYKHLDHADYDVSKIKDEFFNVWNNQKMFDRD